MAPTQRLSELAQLALASYATLISGMSRAALVGGARTDVTQGGAGGDTHILNLVGGFSDTAFNSIDAQANFYWLRGWHVANDSATVEGLAA